MKSLLLSLALLAAVVPVVAQPAATTTAADRERRIEQVRAVLETASPVEEPRLASAPSPFKFDRSIPQEEGPAFTDSQILRRVGQSLRESISGTIRRGDTVFLQSTRGSLVQAGAQFNVSVRQLADRQITIEVVSISDDGFELAYREARAYFPIFPESTGINSNNLRRTGSQ